MTTANLAVGLLADAGDWNHMGGWGWTWATLMMLGWIAIIATLVWAVGRGRRDEAAPPRARDILDERYARGEISTEEYHERIDHLH